MIENKTLIMTYPHITNQLERRILAGALNTFRKLKRPSTNCKYYIFISAAVPGAFDECIIDAATWKLKEVNYDIWKGDKMIHKTIQLS